MKPVTLELANKEHPLYERLEKLAIPGNKTEQYRNFAIKPVLAKEYKLETPKTDKLNAGSRLIIENGVVKEFPKGVKVSFDDEFRADSEHFDALYYMSHILTPSVISIEVDEDIVFEIQHIFDKKQTLLPYRISIKTAPNSKIEVFETFLTEGSEDSLLLYGIDADVSRDSTLRWIRDENTDVKEAIVVGTHRYNIAKQGALELKTFDFGSGNILHLYKIDLANYAWTDAAHLLLATENARRGNVLHINHNEEYAKSVQEARSILKGQATGIFDAIIRVGHNAKYANAAQNSKAILLSESSHMYAKPQLEIYTDELEASHGSTIGQLDEDALFYLRSRGVVPDEAKKMLVLAFADILIDAVGDGKYAKVIHTDFETAYYR